MSQQQFVPPVAGSGQMTSLPSMFEHTSLQLSASAFGASAAWAAAGAGSGADRVVVFVAAHDVASIAPPTTSDL
jgi:hypothetical protein